MTQKWGALPMAVWLAIEAKGNDENLIKWVQKGPDTVIPLAIKYLSEENKIRLEEAVEEALELLNENEVDRNGQ